MKKLKIILLAGIFLCFGISSASALYMADITYDYTDNGGGNFTFNFTVNNTSTGGDTGGLDFFLIDFDADPTFGNYSNLTWTADNGWFSDAFQFDAAFGTIPAAVTADDSAAFGSGGGGISQGAALGGFMVSFDYTGSLLPTDQLFSWYANFGTSGTDNGGNDLGGYWALGEAFGTTRYVTANPDPIPEPTTLLLLGVGLIGLFGFIRRKK